MSSVVRWPPRIPVFPPAGTGQEPAGDALTGEATARRVVLLLVQVVVRHQRMPPWTGFEQGDDGVKGVREVRHGWVRSVR